MALAAKVFAGVCMSQLMEDFGNRNDDGQQEQIGRDEVGLVVRKLSLECVEVSDQ